MKIVLKMEKYEEKELFKCPFCDYRSEYLRSIKVHVHRMHMDGRCPICGRKLKILSKHAYELGKSDDLHAVLYYLVTDKYVDNEVYRRGERLAYEMLRR